MGGVGLGGLQALGLVYVCMYGRVYVCVCV